MNDTAHAATQATARDVLSLLHADHEAVERLFREYERLGDEDASERYRELASRMCDELVMHAVVEEELFYPALKQANVPLVLLERAHHDHVDARALVSDIRATQAGDRDGDWKIGQLIRAVRAHVDKEEADLFPLAREANLDLVALGERVQRRKAELVDQRSDGPPLNRRAGDPLANDSA